jgi:2-oxoisovalerate dehydrogenase E1 component alpha subunit
MTSTVPSPTFIRDLYARMLLTRIVDDYTWKLHTQGFIDFVASCRGHEAAQVGSAVCIEVGKDFTLPYYRDLGVVLTIGMTPREVFRTYLQNRLPQHPPLPLTPSSSQGRGKPVEAGLAPDPPFQHWGYHKHNMVTGPAPVATQLLHAAGIAFASKLRKASVVTVAYCGDGVTTEPDFLEGLRFASQHRLPVIFICEQAFTHPPTGTAVPPSCMHSLSLPGGLTHQQVDGTDVVTVYQSMQSAMQHARKGQGPILLEMYVVRPVGQAHRQPILPFPQMNLSPGLRATKAEGRRSFRDGLVRKEGTFPFLSFVDGDLSDPLVHCQHFLQMHNAWDDDWARQLYTRISAEIECAWRDVLHDMLQST